MWSQSKTAQVTQWLELGRRGDAAAQQALIAYTADRMRTLARRMLSHNRLHRWEQTDDVLQQLLIRIHRHLSNCRAESTAGFLGFAALELRHALVDLTRHYFGPQGMGTHHLTNGFGSANCDTPPREPVDDAATPSQVVNEAERWHRLCATVDGLPPEEREVVDLLWLQGLSHAEAAELLHVSERTIGRRWRCARLLLYERLLGELPAS